MRKVIKEGVFDPRNYKEVSFNFIQFKLKFF